VLSARRLACRRFFRRRGASVAGASVATGASVAGASVAVGASALGASVAFGCSTAGVGAPPHAATRSKMTARARK